MKSNFSEITKIYQRYKAQLFPVIVGLSSLILIFFVIYPQSVQLISIRKQEGELVKRSKLLETKTQTLQNYDENDLKTKAGYATTAYPIDKEIISAYGLLEALVNKTGYVVTSLSLGGTIKEGDAQGINLKIDLMGPSSLLPVLLKDIEDSSRLMRVASVETTTSAGSQTANVTINVSALFAPAPTAFGSVDSVLPVLTEKDQEIINKLAQLQPSTPQESAPLGPRGKENPFQ